MSLGAQRASTVGLVAGGTGGHVYPALAVAEELLRRGAEVHWFGRPQGLEVEVTRSLRVSYHPMGAGGVRGLSPLRALLGGWSLLVSALRLGLSVRRHRIGTVLGFGGYVSVPGCLGARIGGARLGIQEQNARPGTATRTLGLRLAQRAFFGLPAKGYGGSDRVQVVGNPVRSEFQSLPQPQERGLGAGDRAPRLLVMGGSQGAACLNEVLPQALAKVPQWEVFHLAGPNHLEKVREAYGALGGALGHEARVEGFSTEMQQALCWADLVVCRAGAMTLAELAAVGLGAVLVPFAAAIDDHQAANAVVASGHGAALVVREDELRAEGLAQLLEELAQVDGSGRRERLCRMAQSMRELNRPDAAARIADWAMHAEGAGRAEEAA